MLFYVTLLQAMIGTYSGFDIYKTRKIQGMM